MQIITDEQEKNKICEECGNPILGRGNRFCSKKCREDYWKTTRRNNGAYQRDIVPKCKVCGKDVPKWKHFYCSPECKSQSNNSTYYGLPAHGMLEKECQYCGKPFQTYRGRQKYCSNECARIHKNIKHIKRYKGITIDKDITLKKLYERDNGICKLCGLPTNWDDTTEKDGNKICGNMYPSIDHIKPISLGGKHAWDNVQLAHRICNSIKQNAV